MMYHFFNLLEVVYLTSYYRYFTKSVVMWDGLPKSSLREFSTSEWLFSFFHDCCNRPFEEEIVIKSHKKLNINACLKISRNCLKFPTNLADSAKEIFDYLHVLLYKGRLFSFSWKINHCNYNCLLCVLCVKRRTTLIIIIWIDCTRVLSSR